MNILLIIYSHSVQDLYTDVRKDVSVLKLYFVPALLYCFYNNLAFLNLSTFDPTTYYLLLQLRVVITGILFQVLIILRNSTLMYLLYM